MLETYGTRVITEMLDLHLDLAKRQQPWLQASTGIYSCGQTK